MHDLQTIVHRNTERAQKMSEDRREAEQEERLRKLEIENLNLQAFMKVQQRELSVLRAAIDRLAIPRF